MSSLSLDKRRLLERRLRGVERAPRQAVIKKHARLEFAPLSFAQRQVWLIEQVAPGNPAYNLPVGYTLNGALDFAALEESFNQVIARHEALKTVFTVWNGEPVQSVQAECRVKIEVTSFIDLSEPERTQRVQELASREAVTPFELSQLPLLRVRLCCLAKDEHVLIVNVHHIVADGLSISLLLKELDLAYRSLTSGRTPVLPDLPVQYSDFALWQLELTANKTYAGQIAYWERALAGELPVLELPWDRRRPAVQSFRGANVFFKIPSSLVRDLSRLGTAEGCSFFMVALTAFQILLHRYSGAEDLIIGSPLGVRNAPEIELLFGNFVNMLVLRADLTGNPSVRQLLGRVKETTLHGMSNQDVPFAQLMQCLHFERDPSRNPVFQTILQVLPAGELKLGELGITPFHFDLGFAQFDLALHLYEETDGYFGRFEYCTDLFNRPTVERLSRNFLQLLTGLARDPSQSIAQLPILDSAESHCLLVDWNATDLLYPKDKCLHQLVEDSFRRNPDGVAVEDDHARLTYRELNDCADHLATQLRRAGVARDVIVPICVERSVAMVVGVLGILKAGGAYLPLDPSHPAERLHFMLADCQARVIVTNDSLTPLFAGSGATLIHLESNGHVRNRAVGGETVNGVSSDQLAYVIYTSGSTGRPKGVQICHRSVVNLLTSVVSQLELTDRDVVLAVTTLSFDIATAEIFLPLMVGGKVVIVSQAVVADGQRLLAKLESSQATFLQPTPATWRLLLAAGWKGTANLKMVSTGEALPEDLARELLPNGQVLWNLYGPTETTIWSTGGIVAASDPCVSIGRPLGNTQVFILDQHLQPVPIGAVGELCLAGDGIARGYLNRPDLTAERFVANPFSSAPDARLYRTSDLARYREDGTIECLGRIDHQVKIRGFRIEPGEIEAILRAHPNVAGAVVVATEHTRTTEKILVAYLVPKHQPPTPVPDLRNYLKASLPEYMVPAGFVFLESLPLTSTGKINRRGLPAWVAADRLETQGSAPARSPLELQLTRIWEQVLGVQPVQVTDNFFDLGGHSLLAVRLVGEISKSLACDVRILTLLQNPTVAKLAAVLPNQGPWTREPAVFTLRPDGTGLPLFFAGGDGWEFSVAALMQSSNPVFALDVPLSLPVLRAAVESRTDSFPTVEELASVHATLIRRQHPSGSCILAGHCFNGLIAFETARQLSNSGVKVEALFLLDAWLKAHLPWRSVRNRLVRHARNVRRQGVRYLQSKARLLWPWSNHTKNPEPLTPQAITPPFVFDESSSQVPWVLTERVIIHATKHYKLRPLPIRGVLFLADQRVDHFYADDGKAQASHLFRGGLKIVEVPGDHISIFEDPNRRVLVQRIQESLSEF